MPTSTDARETPQGFRVTGGLGGAFVNHCGPVFGKLEDGRLVLGFRVGRHHVNPLEFCHGGMLATFSDILLACSAMYQPQARGRILPTISLQLDYLTAAPLGAWVEGRAEILRTTRSMIFSQGLVTVDGDPAVRISCISKIGPIVGDGQNSDPLRILGEA
jgi:uncharacterized protein (TIGR00369 family)